MYLATIIFWVVPLINAIPTTTESAADSTTFANQQFIPESTRASTETTTVNTIEVLQNQLNQILVQFCASEIDRNKTASAILKFGQLANSKGSIKHLVQFYTENYEDSFDNLLLFINHISSLELQKIAYSTLVEAIPTNQMNVINLLSFENFIRTKFVLTDEDNVERRIYKDLLDTIGNHIKELIVATDLNRVIMFINNSTNPDHIFELIPTIVQGIDLNNFTDMNRIFEFSMQLPIVNQIKLISKVIKEMRDKTQYRHIFHVICQIRLLRNSIDSIERGWTTPEICSLSALEHEIPAELRPLLANYPWRIKKTLSEFLFYSWTKYSKQLLFVSSVDFTQWTFDTKSLNSVTISQIGPPRYLSVDYCFHNESFPVVKVLDYNDLSQTKWYLLFSHDDLNDIQIKNIHTNELLVADDVWDEAVEGPRVALSAKCFDCISSKWSLELVGERRMSDIYSRYSCPHNLNTEIELTK